MQSCNLYFTISEESIKIYHENTSYSGSEKIRQKQKELNKDYDCMWGYTSEIKEEKEKSLDQDKPRNWIVMQISIILSDNSYCC